MFEKLFFYGKIEKDGGVGSIGKPRDSKSRFPGSNPGAPAPISQNKFDRRFGWSVFLKKILKTIIIKKESLCLK